MKRARTILNRLLYPPKLLLIIVPPLSFAVLILIFASNNTESAPAYAVYLLSAYSLVILSAAFQGLTKRVKSAIMTSSTIQNTAAARFAGRYITDIAFRGSVGIYQGMAANYLYAIFRVAAGVRYASVWFISMAIYYLVLGVLRTYLIICSRRGGAEIERRCYRRTAWLLFLLNIPMGGMIAQMVFTNSGFTYPGTVIYLSALYTFYSLTMAVVNLVRFRRLGSPILSAAKVLNFVSAMMSILGLQTAMIAHFSMNGDSYRRMMNAITGSVVYAVIIVFMLRRERNAKRKLENVE